MTDFLGQFLGQHILQKLPCFFESGRIDIPIESTDLPILWRKIEFDFLKNPKDWVDICELENVVNQTGENAHDIWGRVYEFFYMNELIHSANGWQITALPPERRILGRIYTPEAVIQYICREIHQIYHKTKSGPGLNYQSESQLKVADISSGTGRFLIEFLSIRSPHNSEQYFAYDIDPRAIEIAQNNPKLNQEKIEWHNSDILITKIPEKFDIIIGNPPYIESRAIEDGYWDKLRKGYISAHKKFDLSVIFLERILQLLKPGGLAGIIITNKWLVSDYGQKIREILLNETRIHRILDLSEADVFKNVSTYPMIIFFEKCSKDEIGQEYPGKEHNVELGIIKSLQQLEKPKNQIKLNSIPQQLFKNFPKSIIPIDLDNDRYAYLHFFWERIGSEFFTIRSSNSPYEIRDGIHTGNIKEKLMGAMIDGTNLHDRKIITSRKCVSRYVISWQGEWIRYTESIIAKDQGDYAALRERWIFEAPQKIVIKLFGKRLTAARDATQLYANNSLSLIVKKKNVIHNYIKSKVFRNDEEEFLFLTAILNSKVISAYYSSLFAHTHVRGEYIQFYIKDLELIPLPQFEKLSIAEIQHIVNLSHQLEIAYRETKPISVINELEIEMDNTIMDLYQLAPELCKIVRNFIF